MSATALKRTPLPVFSYKKTYSRTPVPEVFFDRVAHHQTCNFIEKKLQHRCFTVNFAKLLKALCRISSVSASNFNLTSLTLRPKDIYLYVFPALLFYIFISHFIFLIEVRNKSIQFYTIVSNKLLLTYNILVFCCAANQCSEITGFVFNSIRDGPFRGCSPMGGKPRLPKICHTYPTKMELGTVIPYLKKTDPKNI